MVKRRGPPSQGWRTFLRNHAPDIAAMDLFVVPTIGFDLLYAFVIVRLDRARRSCKDEVADATTTIAKPLTLEIDHMLRDETAATATRVGRALNCSASGIWYAGCVIFAHRRSPPRRRTAVAA